MIKQGEGRCCPGQASTLPSSESPKSRPMIRSSGALTAACSGIWPPECSIHVVAISASKLRENIYRLLDQVLETGTPLEIERNGRKLLIIASDTPGRLSRLVRRRDVVVGDPEDLVHVDWSAEWRP